MHDYLLMKSKSSAKDQRLYRYLFLALLLCTVVYIVLDIIFSDFFMRKSIAWSVDLQRASLRVFSFIFSYIVFFALFLYVFVMYTVRREVAHNLVLVFEIALLISKRYGLQLRANGEDNHRVFQSLRSLTDHIGAQRTA